MKKTKSPPVPCEDCGKPIPRARLEVVPEATQCVPCAERNPKPVYFDVDAICAQSSPAGGNGWSPKS